MKDFQWFLVGTALVLAGAYSVNADVLVTRSGSHTGTITKVQKDAVVIKTGEAELTILRRDIVRVEVPEPKEVQQGRTAVKEGKPGEVVNHLQSVVERLAGLSVRWVPECMLLLTDAGIQTKDFALAKKTMETLQAEYPTWLGEGEAEVRLARIQCEQKQCDPASAAVNGIIAQLLKKEYLTGSEEQTMAEAYLVLGDCQIAGGQKDAALDSYLRVVTLYDLDAGRAGQAQFNASRLFEAATNWKRARVGYREALERAPNAGWAAEAKRRLAAIDQAHPE
jgi:tetratricopeptide (TPR) repeat protein